MSRLPILHHAVMAPGGNLLCDGDRVVIGSEAELAPFVARKGAGYKVMPVFGPEVPERFRRPTVHVSELGGTQ